MQYVHLYTNSQYVREHTNGKEILIFSERGGGQELKFVNLLFYYIMSLSTSVTL